MIIAHMAILDWLFKDPDEMNAGKKEQESSAQQTMKKATPKELLQKARKFVDPEGESRKSIPEEFQYLADKVGFTPPAGMKNIKDQVKAFDEFLFGKKSSTRKSGAPDFIDEMVEEWGITPDPAADSEQKLKLVEDILGKDPAKQEEKSFKERLLECWDDTFGRN